MKSFSIFDLMDKISFSLETLLKHVKDYFETSLRYFPQKYLYFFLISHKTIMEPSLINKGL